MLSEKFGVEVNDAMTAYFICDEIIAAEHDGKNYGDFTKRQMKTIKEFTKDIFIKLNMASREY